MDKVCLKRSTWTNARIDPSRPRYPVDHRVLRPGHRGAAPRRSPCRGGPGPARRTSSGTSRRRVQRRRSSAGRRRSDDSGDGASHLGVVRPLARSDVAQAAAQHSRLAGCPVGRGDPRGSPASSWPARERSRRGHRPSMV